MFMTHGMGQQVPFTTLDAVFERLRLREPFASARPEAETVRLGGQQMQRLVLRLPALEREIHFYEGYWAPLTEGEVTLRDIVRFLLRAGVNGSSTARPVSPAGSSAAGSRTTSPCGAGRTSWWRSRRSAR